MKDGPIIDLPRSEYRWIGETARRIKERLPPMWERVWFFGFGLLFGGCALRALWLGVTGQFQSVGQAFFTFAGLALFSALAICGAIWPKPLPVKQPGSSNAG